MRKIYASLLIYLIFGAGAAMAQKDYCFENIGLKETQKVSFILINNKIEGVFEAPGDGSDSLPARKVNFTGIKTGTLLTIKFDGGKAPYERPPRTKSIVWTLGAKSLLRIPIYGKNYNTGKYSTYMATYEICREE